MIYRCATFVLPVRMYLKPLQTSCKKEVPFRLDVTSHKENSPKKKTRSLRIVNYTFPLSWVHPCP